MLLEAEDADRAAPSRPLGVLIVNDYAAPAGGTDTVALAEAAGLARRGHRVTLLAGSGEPGAALVDAGVTVRLTGQESTLADPNRARAAARGIWNRSAAAAARELAREADVVHVHGFTKVMSPSVIRALVGSQVPTVATLHDYFVACPNGGFFNYRTEQICRLTPLSAQCLSTNCDVRAYSHKLWRVSRAAVQRWPGEMPAGIGHFIVPSGFPVGVLRPFLPVAACVHVVPNPIDVERAPVADAGASEAFVFVGRLRREKGPVLFAHAAREAGVRAVFVGAGEDAEAIRSACPDAEVTGWVDAAQVNAAIRSARAVVVPSQCYEVAPLSPLEAAAQGVPAIVADSSAGRDAVEDGVTGVWFRGGDAGDLAAKLRGLARDGGLARRLGAAAYERFWSERHDVDMHVERLEHVYGAALAS
jgi:glycosyltransferase involved in cell wall biosynthesis